jgi:hypothetical protein
LVLLAWAVKDYEAVIRPNLEFVHHDGANLAGDLYQPKGLDKARWQLRSGAVAGRPAAVHPTPVFSIDYRLRQGWHLSRQCLGR